jgi:hypothetical protein
MALPNIIDDEQPLLFMVHGVGEPFNTKSDRTKIAKHLSDRYHRRRKKSLQAQPLPAPRKSIAHEASFHHGGQRIDMHLDTRPAKRAKLMKPGEWTGKESNRQVHGEWTTFRVDLKDVALDTTESSDASSPRTGSSPSSVASSKSSASDYDDPPADCPLVESPPVAKSSPARPLNSLPIALDGSVSQIIDYCERF